MKHLKSYKIFESMRSVVTFDFDGVMHTGVQPGTIHPLPDPNAWTPNEPMIEKLRDEAKTHDIYIVTARDGYREYDGGNPWVERFVKMHDLPVVGIVCTNNLPKLPYLEKLHSIRHYDDNPAMTEELVGSGIEFILVDTDNVENNKVYTNG